MYIRDGVGWTKGLLRDHEAVLDCSSYAKEIGPGDDHYTQYDLSVTRNACDWLHNKENQDSDKPWALFVSWLRPHYPLTCPEEFYNLYPLEQMDQPRFLRDDERPSHQVLQAVRKNFDYEKYFIPETKKVARASYYGLCSFLDYQVGQVLKALETSGQAENTLIIYTSDHGDHNGDRGLWTKMTMYDESSSIPMIIAGPGIPKQKTVTTLSSLIDIYPTILEATGASHDSKERPGMALQTIANSDHLERDILSEYHDGGSPTGMFMLRTDGWKYNYYPGYPSELYHIAEDKDELVNLAESAEHQQVLTDCHQRMLELVDPETENKRAFADQAKAIERLGGVEAILNSDEFDCTPVRS
jgi:choline-sulfatase